MKKLIFLTPLLIIFLILTACQKENTLDNQVILDEQVILDNQEGEAVLRKKKHPVPFHATFISTEDFFGPDPICGEGPPPSNLLLTQTLSGNATHMGNISGDISSCADISPLFNDPPEPPILFNGFTTLVAANGDSLFIVGNANPVMIEGGTGRFDDAAGWVNIFYEEIPPDSGMFESYFEGEIQY